MGSLSSQLTTVAEIQDVEVGPFSRFRGLNYRKFGPKNEKFSPKKCIEFSGNGPLRPIFGQESLFPAPAGNIVYRAPRD